MVMPPTDSVPARVADRPEEPGAEHGRVQQARPDLEEELRSVQRLLLLVRGTPFPQHPCPQEAADAEQPHLLRGGDAGEQGAVGRRTRAARSG